MVSVSEFVTRRISENRNESMVKHHPHVLGDCGLARSGQLDLEVHSDRSLAKGQNNSALFQSHTGDLIEGAAPVGGRLKRIFDILIATTTLLLMAPIFLTIALLIVLTMGRPVFFVQKRVGFNRKSFGCLKFRTMVTNANERLAAHLLNCPQAARDWAENQKLAHDPRVTPLGQILRKSSLDELPQLINIIRGDMSCVGPRPVLEEELSRYGLNAREYIRARPGLTGMWQVNGRNSTTYAHRVKYDRYYVMRWSFLLDLGILVRTIPAVMKFDETS